METQEDSRKRKRFTAESINPLWLHATRGQGRIGLPCPLCRQPMFVVALSDRAEVNVDVCQRCHFIWFDAHEVDTLVPRQPERPAPELPQKAREMLAIAEVERLSKQAEGSDFDSAAPEESWKQIAAFLGMPVEFDSPEQQRRPWATWLLSAAIDGYRPTVAAIASVENAAGSAHFFQRHVAPRAGERGVVRHSVTHVNVIPSEVEGSRRRVLGGSAGSFDFALLRSG